VSPERFGEQSLSRALRENLERLATLEGTAFKGALGRDPTGELRSLAEAAGQGAPASRHGVWFSGDGARALLLAQTAASGMAAVGVLFGTVHGITLAFGATLIGEAVDYPSYVFTQRKPGESVLEILARVWPTLRLAVLTTVFGSLALLLSSLQGLSQLGVLSM